MDVRVPEGLLGRPVAEFAEALAIAAFVFRTEPRSRWLGGMLQTGQWIAGSVDTRPITGDVVAPTRESASHEVMEAGKVVMEFAGANPDVHRDWARGSMRMLRYALGFTDELPVRLPAVSA